MPGLIGDWNTAAAASSTTPISTSRSLQPMPVIPVSRNKVSAGSGSVCQPYARVINSSMALMIRPLEGSSASEVTSLPSFDRGTVCISSGFR